MKSWLSRFNNPALWEHPELVKVGIVLCWPSSPDGLAAVCIHCTLKAAKNHALRKPSRDSLEMSHLIR